MTNDSHNLLKNKKIIIYGAGRIGQRIFFSLKSSGYPIEFFWDRNVDIIDKFTDVSVLKPDPSSILPEMRKEYVVLVTVSAKNVSKEIADNLSEFGYNAVHDRGVINSIIYQTCKMEIAEDRFSFDLQTCHTCPVPKENPTNTSCDIFDGYMVKNLVRSVDHFIGKKEKLVIPKIGLLVSNKCNLCCKGCNHLIDLKEPGDNLEFTADELLGDLTRIVEVVDLIDHVVVVGGEAFLHPNLYEILEKILKLPKIGYALVITSGSVKPRDPRLFELMANKRVVVEISGYGTELPKRIATNVESFMSELRRHKVSHYYFGMLQWFDFGDFSHRPYSRERHHEVYKTCCSVSNDIFNGKLWKCSRAAVATHQGRIPDFPEDYVDLRKYSGAELKNRLLEYLGNEYPLACLQCNGASIVIDAGVQVPRFIQIGS